MPVMLATDAKIVAVEEEKKKKRKPLRKWIDTKNGKQYMILARTPPRRQVTKNGFLTNAFNNQTHFIVFKNKTSIGFWLGNASTLSNPAHSTGFKYCFSKTTTKTGKVFFNFYQLAGQGQRQTIRSVSPYRMLSAIDNCKMRQKKYDGSSGKRYWGGGLPEEASKMLRKIVFDFLAENYPGKSFVKYLPRDPMVAMLLACYPGYEIFKKQVQWSSLPIHRSGRKDVCSYLLKTNGSKTRKKLINAVEEWRFHSDSISNAFYFLRYVSVKYGSGFGIELLEAMQAHRPQSPLNLPNRRSFEKYKFLFKHYSKHAFNQLLFSGYTMDTIHMLSQLENFEIENWDNFLRQLQHRRIKEIHDELAIVHRNEVARRKHLRAVPALSCSLDAGVFAKELERANPAWLVIFAESEVELAEWSQKMSNCISSYAYSISRGNCDCIAIIDKNTGEMLYNIELRREDFRITQALRKYNLEIPEADKELIFSARVKAYRLLRGFTA